jgi:hypothetical protein
MLSPLNGCKVALTVAGIVASQLAGETVMRGQVDVYPVFAEEHLDRAMTTLGMAFALVTAMVERNEPLEAKDFLARSREQLAPTRMYWKDRNQNAAIEMLNDALGKIDALDAGLSEEPINVARVQMLAREVDMACNACHAKFREQDPVSKKYHVKRDVVR